MIKPYEKNAKKHPEKQLELIASSIRDFGWQQPIKVGTDNVIIVGHGRYQAYNKYKEAYNLKEPWIVDKNGKTISGGPETRELTEIEEKDYRLRDNKIAESEWDMNLVVPELKFLDDHGIDIKLTGFDETLILDDDEDDDVVPDTPETPKSAPGDIYELGKHRLICGDSTHSLTYEKLLGTGKADMVFTDPPYNVNYKGQGKQTSNGIMNDHMSSEQFDTFLGSFFETLAPFIKQGAGWYVFHSSSTQAQFEKALNIAGLEVKAQLIWNKPMAALGWGDYRWKHEPFFYAGKKGESIQFYGDRTHKTVWDFQDTEQKLLQLVKKLKRQEQEGKTTVWSMKRDSVNEYVHPTQKPVELITYAIANSTKHEDVIVDAFTGSGSTLIACEKMQRVFYGVELDPKYVDVIVQRYVNYTGNTEVVKNGHTEIWEVTKNNKKKGKSIKEEDNEDIINEDE